MKSISLKGMLATALLAVSAMSSAALVDLSTWSAEGQGTWTLQGSNDTVKQTVNGEPTVFFNGLNSQGTSLSGEITVETTSDDDFIGFVLGYNAGDLTNSSADYLLIDWKQSDQSFFGGTALEGLAVSRVTGELNDGLGPWVHDPANNVTELQRATNLGSTGWLDNTLYEFDLVFTDSLVQVFVNNVLELNITGTFSDGSFGFYNYSQQNVLYAGITEDVVVDPDPNEVSAPGAATVLVLGLAIMFVRRNRSKK